MDHTFKLALLGGFFYLLVWWLYRWYQRRVHARYSEEHAQERIRRTNYDIRYPSVDPEELLRRAAWEGEHGHLMSAMDIRNREENRWPLGNAFQGLAGLVTGLVIATLVWDGRSGSPPPNTHETSITPPASTVTVVADHATLFDQEFLLLLLMVSAGGLFWKLSKTKLGAGVGGGLILTASLFSGMKILSVEKVFAIDKLLGIDVHVGTPAPPPVPPASAPPAPPSSAPASTYSLAIALPAFSSGSATPGTGLRCAVAQIATDMARMPGLFSVVVTTGADRQELNANTRKLYANNWSLAQQRGNAVAALLAPRLPTGANILVTNAGPAHTSGARDAALMEQDRTPILRLTGLGTLPAELPALAQRTWPAVCNL